MPNYSIFGSIAKKMTDRKITIYHSPDADDAFMFYGLVHGGVGHPGYEFDHELSDIESLNKRTLKGELDVTAISVHSYPYLNNQYAILTCGASMGGEDYGPRLVMNQECDLADGVKRTIATPGKYTSAALALRIYLHEKGIEANVINMDFDEVQQAVIDGKIDGGVIIHEGQITHHKEGLTTVVDLGKWWWDETGLPLPLGVNVVKKSIGYDAMEVCKSVLKQSIECAMDNRDAALDYALTYGRGIDKEEADTFVGMYVNDKTLDLGNDGVESIRLFLEKGAEYGFIPEKVELEFI